MLSRSRTRWMVTAAALLAASAAGTGQIATQASTATPQATQGTRAQQTASYWPGNGDRPRQVYAPCYESWESGGIAQSAAQSGSPYETIAFIQAPAAGSCSLTWNGDSTEPIPGTSVAADIATLQRHGGQLVEEWAAHRQLPLQVQYTIPVLPSGLTASGIAVLQNAVATGTRIDVVNIMTFDYYLASEPAPLDMGAEALSAAQAAHTQLAALYPAASSARLRAMEGITLMPGIDDYPGKTEITSLADARQVLGFAGEHGLALLSIWAIQRDNGGCPGAVGASTCSGIAQNSWDFSHLLEHVTR